MLSEDLHKMREELGRLPTLREVINDPTRPSRSTYIRWFEHTEWIGILEEAKLFDSATDLLELKSQLLFKVMMLGRVPTTQEVFDDPEMEHPETYVAAFGMRWQRLMDSLTQA